jgi:hypothetical protein
MTPRFRSAVTTLLAATACATASVYKPDVIGPHGEHLIELSCPTPDACMELGRQTCRGDFDIVTSSDVPDPFFGGAKTNNLMLIQCKTPSAAVAAPPPEGRPDGG